MVIIGLVLILVGAVVILAAVSSNDAGSGGEILGFAVTTLESFFVGVEDPKAEAKPFATWPRAFPGAEMSSDPTAARG